MALGHTNCTASEAAVPVAAAAIHTGRRRGRPGAALEVACRAAARLLPWPLASWFIGVIRQGRSWAAKSRASLVALAIVTAEGSRGDGTGGSPLHWLGKGDTQPSVSIAVGDSVRLCSRARAKPECGEPPLFSSLPLPKLRRRGGVLSGRHATWGKRKLRYYLIHRAWCMYAIVGAKRYRVGQQEAGYGVEK